MRPMLASAVVIGARLWVIGDLESHVLDLSLQVAENYFTLIVAPGVETRTAGPLPWGGAFATSWFDETFVGVER